MFAQKLKAVPIAVGLSSMAVLAWAFFAPAAVPTHDTPPRSVETVALPQLQPAAAPKALPKGPNKLLFYRAGHLTLIDPDGKNEKAVSQDRGKFHPGDAKLSPDGKQLAILIQEVSKPGEPPVRRLHVRALEEKEPGTDLGVSCQLFAWSPDGTEIVCSDFVDRSPEEGPPEVTSFIVNVKSKEKTAVKLPANHIVTDWSRDGKYFLTSAMQLGKDGPSSRLYMMNRDGTEHKALTDAKTVAMFGRLSADGRRVLFSTMILPKEKDQAPKRELAVLDIGTGKTTTVEELPLNGEVQAYCWSPDGKQIAYSWRELHEGKPEDVQNKETESFLVVCDPDGKNAKTIATEKGMGQGAITIGHIDWR